MWRIVNARLAKPTKDPETFLSLNLVFRQKIEKIKDHNDIVENKGKEKGTVKVKDTHNYSSRKKQDL